MQPEEYPLETEYVSPTLTYQHRKDYSFKIEQHVSILTLDGRVIVPYTGYSKHIALIQAGAEIGAAKLWYDKPRKQFYLLVSLEIVRTVIMSSMLTWSVPGILRCERFWLGKTGPERVLCQSALMCQAIKPKQSAFAGTLSCGGA